MNPTNSRLLTVIFAGGLLVACGSSEIWAQAENPVGFVIAMEGQVFVTPQAAPRRSASLREEVLTGHIIETGAGSATKILFVDNTLLSVSENTKIEVGADRSDADGDSQTATDSRFKIRTPTGVASTQEAEYVVWTYVRSGVPYSAVAVTAGSVTVTNLVGQSRMVEAGHFTTASRFHPPRSPSVTSGNQRVQQQIHNADVKTDQRLVAQVTIQVAQQRQRAKLVIARGTKKAVQPTKKRMTLVTLASGRIKASVTEIHTTTDPSPDQQTSQASPGGVSPLLGTTNTPCRVVSQSGNVPLGCTPL